MYFMLGNTFPFCKEGGKDPVSWFSLSESNVERHDFKDERVTIPQF